jgi:hypothetical protein
MGGTERDLTAYYAEGRRRWDIARQEFAERIDGWSFALSAEAETWSAAWQRPIDETNLVGLVEQAQAAGLFVVSEAGSVRNAFSYRDPDTEVTTGEGFGFWPASAEFLVIHGSRGIEFAELPALDALGVLLRVADTFQAPRASSTPA